MNSEELKASALLLDIGVAVPLRPVRYLKALRIKTVVMRTPTLGTLTRMAHLYLSMGINMEALKENSFEDDLRLVTEHGVTMSRIVAYAISPRPCTNRLIAWYLRKRMHPSYLSEAMFQLMQLLDLKSFRTTIDLVGILNPMKPGQIQEGS